MRVSAAVLLAVIAVVVGAKEKNDQEPLDKPLITPHLGNNGLSRVKRQTYYYYLCGTAPNQFYSYYPCNYYTSSPTNMCSNGGQKIGVGCYTASQCTPYYSGVAACISNCCCTVPAAAPPTNSTALWSISYNSCNYGAANVMTGQKTGANTCTNGGTKIAVGCTVASQCTPYYNGPVTCLNSCCCTVPVTPTVAPPLNTNTCSNGGTKIGIGCTTVSQCTPYYSGVVACLENCCCTVPNVQTTAAATCWPGQTSTVRCSAMTCSAGLTCTNGLCCPQAQAWQYACGGEAATAACTNGACSQGNACTTSNYCCECPVGRSCGQAINGVCPAGYVRNPNNNHCCSACTNGQAPFGICTATGGCPSGYACSAGNICCLNAG